MKLRDTQKKPQGFTLIEMVIALTMSMGVAASLVILLSQQVAFMRILTEFRFLRNEAPQINTLITNIVNKADSYRIYGSIVDAKAQSNAIRADGAAARLRYRNPDGTRDDSIIAFETVGGEKQLNYYFKPSGTLAWPSTPAWTISAAPDAVTFDNSTGILLITLTGATGDEITYAGNPE